MKTGITNTLFLAKANPRLVLGTTENSSRKSKLVSLEEWDEKFYTL